MSNVIDFSEKTRSVKRLIENISENIDDVEDIVIILTNKDGQTKTTWSEQSIMKVVFAAKILDMDIVETIDE